MNNHTIRQQGLFAIALAACTLMACPTFAATGEVTLSGSTWTGKVDGTTKYTGSDVCAAITACSSAMSSGTINLRASGTGSTIASIGSNIWLVGNGFSLGTSTSASGSAVVRAQNKTNIVVQNLNMSGTAPWFGMYFQSSSNQTFSSVSGQGGGICYRIDNCKGAWGSNFKVSSTSINVSNTGGHGVETMGIQGSSFNTINSNSHSDGCGVLIQSYNNSQANTGGTVMATGDCYGCGYAGFRTANTNRNQTLTYDDATSCGRGYFSVSTSQDCTITRVNATNCSDIGVWLQSSANTHVSGGTISNCGSCSSISSPLAAGNNSVTVTCR